MTTPSPGYERLFRKLNAIHPITDADRAALADLPLREKKIAKNTDVVKEGDAPRECCLLIEGFLCRDKILGEGQRQIFSFHIPGDIPDLQSLNLEIADDSLGALTACTVGFIPRASLTALLAERPNVAAAFWRDTLIEAAVLRAWLAGVGRRSAHQRISHLVCELYVRLEAVGLTDGSMFQLPVNQSQLADALGLSAVHVNRVLQDLRGSGVIKTRGRFVRIEDWERLQAAGDFDPNYLHLRGPS